MYWVYKAGAPGDFERFAMAPGADSNVYQQRLDKHLPLQRARREYYDLPCPITTKPGSRETMHTLVVPPYDALDREMQRGPLAADQVAQIVSESAQWGACYKSHPTVRARTTNDPPVIPFAPYLDGMRYSRQIGSGRAQSLFALHGDEPANEQAPPHRGISQEPYVPLRVPLGHVHTIPLPSLLEMGLRCGVLGHASRSETRRPLCPW